MDPERQGHTRPEYANAQKSMWKWQQAGGGRVGAVLCCRMADFALLSPPSFIPSLLHSLTHSKSPTTLVTISSLHHHYIATIATSPSFLPWIAPLHSALLGYSPRRLLAEYVASHSGSPGECGEACSRPAVAHHACIHLLLPLPLLQGTQQQPQQLQQQQQQKQAGQIVKRVQQQQQQQSQVAEITTTKRVRIELDNVQQIGKHWSLGHSVARCLENAYN